MREESFVPAHLQAFVDLSNSCYDWTGLAPKQWISWVASRLPNEIRSNASFDPDFYVDVPQTREDIFAMVANPDISTLSCCIAIFAWGGMNRNNGLSVLKRYGDWVDHAQRVREGLDRRAAFVGFHSMRGCLTGMGPAYYTKLIQFMMQRRQRSGYILDQWTSRSVNLLCGRLLISLKKGRRTSSGAAPMYVSDANSAETYEDYCLVVERLSHLLSIEPESAEMRLFSSGRGKGAWRNYVIAHTAESN